jgi:hypothetical protein
MEIIEGDRNNFDKFQNSLRKLIKDTYFKNSIVGEFIEIKQHESD